MREVERWRAEYTSLGGLIPITRGARIVSQLNGRISDSPFWGHVCVLRLRVQGLFGPPSGGTVCRPGAVGLLRPRRVAPHYPNRQNSDLAARTRNSGI